MEIPNTVGTPRGPTVDGASASLLADLLIDLEAELRRAGVPVDDFFEAGVSPSEVTKAFATCGLVAPAEALAWFGWHNGPSNVTGSESVLPMFDFWSMEESVKSYLNPKGQPTGNELWQWNPAWIQIMGDANGIAICCDEPPSQSPLVRGLDRDDPTITQVDLPLGQVVSLCTPVSWWIDSLRNGWYEWNSHLLAWDEPDLSRQPFMRLAHGLS